jgi:F-type H+-transporting ATPase subunit a
MKGFRLLRSLFTNVTIGAVLTLLLMVFWFSANSQEVHQGQPAGGGTTVQTGADSASKAVENQQGSEELSPAEEMLEILQHKVSNTPFIHEYPFPELHLPQDWIVNLGGYSINLSLSRHIVYLLLSALLTAFLLIYAGRRNARNTIPRGFGNLVELVVVFVRDEIVQPFLGKDTVRYLPVLLTFFFFISFTNLIGLLPFGATATGNINITASFALITFSFMVFGGMRANGVIGYWKGIVPHGLPGPLYFIMVPIELLGMLTKPFALAVRLFANMLSGGLVIGAFYALIFGMDTLLIAPVSIAFLLFMSLLKMFVCLLQAYIFTMLSSFFIGMSVHQSH